MIPLILFLVLIAIIVSDAVIKPALFKYFIMIFSLIFAVVIGFNYYEMIAAIMVDKDFIPHMSFGLSFAVITGLSFGVFKAIGDYTIRKEIKFPEKLHRACSIILSIIFTLLLTGVIMVFLVLMPISPKYPYKRFSGEAVIANPQGDLEYSSAKLPADGLITGLFSSISKGSMSSGRSFAVLHDNFITNCFLNRYKIKDETNPIINYSLTEPIKIDFSDKNTVRKAHTALRMGQDNKPLPAIEGREPYVIKLGFNLRAFGSSQLELAMHQLRIICNDSYDEPFIGKGRTEYPYGYVKNGRVERVGVAQLVEFDERDKEDSGRPIQTVEVVFYVPENMVPVAVGFRQNFVAALPEQPNKDSEQSN